MDHERTIHEYLDGGLPPEQQADLFAALAANEELRTEMQAQLRLHLGVKKDQGSVVVPHDATNAIFAELGLPSPITVVPPASTTNVVPSTGRSSAILLLLAFGLLCTGTLIVNRNDGAFLPLDRMAGRGPARPSVISVPDAHTPYTPTAAPPARMTSSVLRDVIVPVTTPVDTTIETAITPATYIDRPVDVASTRYGPNDELPASMMPAPPAVTEQTAREMPFETYLRSMAMRSSDPDPSLADGTSFMMPVAAGVLYDLGGGHAVGVDLGVESVPQVFTRTENGQPVEYRQDPRLFWIGASYRHRFTGLSIASTITPYAGATLAYTQLGPMARMNLGFAITPETRLSIHLGIEGSVLAYPIQSQFFSTRMLQLTYGVAYRF